MKNPMGKPPDFLLYDGDFFFKTTQAGYILWEVSGLSFL